MLHGSKAHFGRGWLVLALALALGTATARAAFNTTVPVSQESASNLAVSLFPVSVKLDQTTLFLTNPRVIFLDAERIGVETAIQAYDHRPEEGVAISETGQGMLSGRVAYDRTSGKVLLHDARVERLSFDRENAATRRFSTELRDNWARTITNPVRADLPPHPYLLPFRDNLAEIRYDGKTIDLVLVYD